MARKLGLLDSLRLARADEVKSPDDEAKPAASPVTAYMAHYTFSDLNRQAGEIVDAALVRPVALTKRGRTKLILLSVDRYLELLQGS